MFLAKIAMPEGMGIAILAKALLFQKVLSRILRPSDIAILAKNILLFENCNVFS